MTDTRITRSNRTRSRGPTARCLACAGLLIGLAGCNSLDSLLTGDKVDYRAGAVQTTGLDVPPDLTQLARDSRYKQDASGSVSAASYQPPQTAGAQVSSTVAPAGGANLAIERNGNDRWIATSMSPEQLWPQLKAFWQERGFTLALDQADVGVMETDWNENRAKIPQDFIRSTVGRVFESAWSSGERDRFRTRLERTANGSEIYISHRGVIEVVTGAQKDSSIWQPRPADPELEAEMLRRLLLKLGAKEEQAAALVANGGPAAARARVLGGASATTLEVDEDFDRAWRRVGLSLDRTGFTVEDRDRAKGTYFVRYADTNPSATKEEPGFLGKLFNFGKDKKTDLSKIAKYRVQVKGEGERSTVSVLNAEGGTESGEVAIRIAALLVEDLK